MTAGDSLCGLVGEVAGEAFGVSILLTLSFTVEEVDKMSRISAVIFLWRCSACDELAAAVGDAAGVITGGGLELGLYRRGSLGGEGRTRLWRGWGGARLCWDCGGARLVEGWVEG